MFREKTIQTVLSLQRVRLTRACLQRFNPFAVAGTQSVPTPFTSGKCFLSNSAALQIFHPRNTYTSASVRKLSPIPVPRGVVQEELSVQEIIDLELESEVEAELAPSEFLSRHIGPRPHELAQMMEILGVSVSLCSLCLLVFTFFSY